MKLRLATMDDALLLYRWRNDPTTIAGTWSNREVGWMEHVGWLSSRIGSANPVYIFEDGAIPIGTAHVDAGGYLGYTIAPEHRGRGLSTLMLRQIRDKHGALTCEINIENKKSISAAQSAGHLIKISPTRG